MKRKYYYIVLIPALMVLVVSCGNKKSQQQGPPPPIRVMVDTVTSTNAVYNDEFPGIITPLDQINLTSQVNGYVTGVYFKDGQDIKIGQLLYTIDAEVYNANYQQAVADLEVQKANLVKAQKDSARYHELETHDAIAKQQVDYADATLAATKKQVAAARATVASVHSNVRFSRIYAPFNGTIGISQVKKGTAVVAGQTILNTVSTNNPIAVDFAVDQKNMYHFTQLESSGDNRSDSIFTISFTNDVYPFPGKIGLIDRAVDPQTGSIKVRLIFPNDKNILRPGMNTTVRVKNTAAKNATVIPFKAVTESLGEFYVYVVGDSSKVSQRQLVLGHQLGENVIVEKGLIPGEKIVVQGIQNLHEGSVVTIDAGAGSGKN